MKMSISRLAIVLISVFSLTMPAGAVRVTPEQAKRAARNWLRKGYGFERRMGADIEAVRTLAGTNGASFHIAAVKGGGFVVLGSDTEDSPVVAVSAQGSGEPDGRSPLWTLLRQDMTARMLAKAEKHRALHAATGTGGATGSSPEGRWARLLEQDEEDEQSPTRRRLLSESDGRTTIADVRVDALLQSVWSQTDYRNYGLTSDDDICYNYYTPNHWPCGCVATAGAQVMRYHSYPTSAVVAGTYACGKNGSPVNLTMFGGTYNWDAMTLVPANGCSATSREAIGRLTYDVGVSVGMYYGSGGSSSSGYMLSKRFVDRFQYANAVSVVFQNGFFRGGDCSYTLARFKSAVIPNLDEGLPVVLGISGSGGHAVVGDGYGYSDGDFFVHINLGWANVDNGNAWYMPPDIERYTSIDSVVYNVYPTGASGASIVSGCILSTEGRPVEGASVRAVAGGASASIAASGARGTYALKVSPGTYWVVAEKDGQSASNRVAVSACVSPHLAENGVYYDDICPRVGNICDNDLTLDVEGTPEPPSPPPPENLTWHTTKAEAFAAAQAGGKRILLVYGRDACGNTTATRNSTCEDATVKAKLLADYVLWYSDCDTQSSESGKYLVNFDGYLPGVTVIDPELDKGIVGTSGYLNVSGMLELLEAAENWEPPEPPGNDDFADAAELTGASGSVTATNEAATPESGEPLLRSYSSATTTVWWKWTAPSDGSVAFDTVGSAFDTVMGVYSGSSLKSLATIAQDDDGGGGRVSKCTFDCTAGTTYYVCVAGYSAAYGNISLQWTLTAADANPITVYEDIDQAKAAATREGKLVFLLSGANWCGYTTKLKQYVTDAGSVFTDNYVYLWHDQDQDAFGIAATSSIPEFWIFRPSDLDLSTKSSWDTISLYVCRGCPTQYDSFLRTLESKSELKPEKGVLISLPVTGWHEVSFPVLPMGGAPADVFAPVADKIGYVTCGSKNWSPTSGGTLTALEIGKGYWVQTTAANVSWTVTGQGNPGVEISLKPGWNLIGYPLLEEGEVETVLATALATENIDYICSGSRVYPGTLTTLSPGKGYWVYANAAVTIRFDAK